MNDPGQYYQPASDREGGVEKKMGGKENDEEGVATRNTKRHEKGECLPSRVPGRREKW